MALKVSIYAIPGSCSDAVWALSQHLGLDAAILERKENEEALLRVNPDRTVPTMVAEDGFVLTETSAILNHFAREHGPELLGRGPQERARNEEALNFLSTSVYNAFLLRFRPDRSADDDLSQSSIRQKSESAIALALDGLTAKISGAPYAMGDNLTTSDFLALVMLKWADNVDPDLLKARPKLQAYYSTLKAMPFYDRAFTQKAA